MSFVPSPKRLLKKTAAWLLLAALVGFLCPVGASHASERLPAANGSALLATVLNPDGTLREGAEGSYNAKGYRLLTAPDGRPVFRPFGTAGAGDQYWQNGFAQPGVAGIVNAIVTRGSDVYVGGTIGLAGDVPVANVAKWDGATWHALGLGVNLEVYTLLLSGTDLYAGGRTPATSTASGSVARWNGRTWSTLGASTGTAVLSLAETADGRLFAGVYFNSGSGALTQWNGSAWSTVSNWFNGRLDALAANGTNLYAGGTFTQTNGVPTNNVAKWDGTAWSALGNGVNGGVRRLAFHGTDLYVTGGFSTAGTTAARGIARWNGTGWNALGAGITGSVDALAFNGNELYVCGQFSAAGGAAANNAAKWDGAGWTDLGAGPSYAFRALALVGSDVYLGGQFDKVGGVGATGIAKRSAGAWSALGTGLNNFVHALAVRGTDVYVAGSFIRAGGIEARYIAKWDGTGWSSLGTGAANGLNGDVYALSLAGNGDVYAGGNFTQAGGIAAAHAAKWDGITWSALGTGTNGPVYALAVNGPDVYAGGGFTTAGGAAANRVAKWSGGTWSALGTGVGGTLLPGLNVQVDHLAVRAGEVYAAGTFLTAGGQATNRLAKWDGTTWSALGAGAGAYFECLAVNGSVLYVGGQFTALGGVAARNIAQWDGTAWNALGAGLNSTVLAVAVRGTEVYATGQFSTSSGTGISSLAKWDGAAWSTLGSGLNQYVNALAVTATGDVAAGGMFTATLDDSKVSSYFGVYWGSLITDAKKTAQAPTTALYPNPARRVVSLQLPATPESRTVWVSDALGREVHHQVLPAQATSTVIDLHGLTPGLYLVRCGGHTTRVQVE